MAAKMRHATILLSDDSKGAGSSSAASPARRRRSIAGASPFDSTSVASGAAQRIRADYDAVSAGAKRLRRSPRIERGGEDDYSQLPPHKRLLLISLCRDAVRNFSMARSIIRQVIGNTIGTDFKLSISTGDRSDAVREAQDWFNNVFARRCYFRRPMHLSEFNSRILQRVIVDGDVGMAIDDRLLDTGKLICYEADQITSPETLPDKVAGRKTDRVVGGVILDAYGREIGYSTCRKIGAVSAPLADCYIWPVDPDGGDDETSFSFLRTPWGRFNAVRGVGEMFGCVADFLDAYEYRSKEMQSAKVGATFGLKVTRPGSSDASAALNDPRFMPASMGGGASASPDDAAAAAGAEPTCYAEMESLAGGYLSYLDEGEDVAPVEPGNRPNLNGEEFTKRLVKSACAGMGFAQCYATMEANTSYTAYRGEMIMSWVTIRTWQKWIERNVQDWQAVRAIRWARAHGVLRKELPPGWENSLRWQHPRMPSVDPAKEQSAIAQAIKNNTFSLEEQFGAEWLDRLDQLQTESEELKKRGLHNPANETVSGSIVDPETEE